MMDFKLADEQIVEDVPLIQAIRVLVIKVIALKKLMFEPTELGFNTTVLETENVLQLVADGKFRTHLTEQFCYVFLKEFCKMKGFEVSDDPANLYRILQALDNHFDEPNNSYLVTELIIKVGTVGLDYQLEYFQPDYIKFFGEVSIDDSEGFLWHFIDSFCGIVPRLEMSAEDQYRLFRQLYGYMNLDNGGYDLNLGNLNSAVMQYATENQHHAKELSALLLRNLDRINLEIVVSLWAGLLIADTAFLDQLREIAKTSVNQPAVLSAIARLSYDKPDMERVIKFIDETDQTLLPNRIGIPQLFVNYLNREGILSEDPLTIELLRRLGDMIKSQELNLAGMTFHQIARLKDREYVHPLLLAAVSTNHFDHLLFGAAQMLLVNYTEPNKLFELVLTFSGKHNVMDFPLDRVMPMVRRKNPEAFDAEMIQLLIDDDGITRFVAGRVLYAISHYGTEKTFKKDLAELDSLSQARLFASVLTGYTEPKYTLPFILPICLSVDEKVRSYCLQRLRTLSEDYGSAVTDLMKATWPSMNTEQRVIFDQVENHMNSFWENIRKKNAFKEINPYYIQAAYIDNFNKSYSKHLSRSMNAHVEKNSIMSQLAVTVEINKGGGWRVGPDRAISQLSTVGVSMSLPRSYFVNPDHFEMARLNERFENWKNFSIE